MEFKKIVFNLGFVIMAFALVTVSSFAFTTELVKTNPAPIVAGDYADITLKFTNLDIGDSGLKENVYFILDETDFIMPVDNEKQVILKVYSGEIFTRTYRAFFSADLEEGYIDLPVIVGVDGVETKKKIRVFVEGSARKPELRLGQITTVPNKLIVDSNNNKLSVVVQNLGDKTAELVKADLVVLGDDLTPSYSYSFEDSLSSIEGGSQGVFEFRVDVEEGAKEEIPVVLKLRYRAKRSVGNVYETFEEEIPFNVLLTPSPFLIIENIEQLDSFKAGSTDNLLRVTIKNIGPKEAEDVRVRIVPDISYPLIFEVTTMYVSAKISPNESADVIYKIEVSEDAGGKKYDSKVVLESLVEDSRFSREDIISITTKENMKKGSQFYAYLIVGFVVLVSVLLGFKTWMGSRKNTRKKK